MGRKEAGDGNELDIVLNIDVLEGDTVSSC